MRISKSSYFTKLIFLLFLLFVFVEFMAFQLLTSENFVFSRSGNSDLSWQTLWMNKRKFRMPFYVANKYYDFDERKGWKLKSGLKNLEWVEGKSVNTNSKGIRGKIEFEYQRNRKFRILTIGDSFTEGSEVSDNETYSFFIEKSLENTEVINMGVGGYGHDQILISLEEEGLKYSPDLVILGFVMDDMNRNVLSFRDYAKPKFELQSGVLELSNEVIKPPQDFMKENVSYLSFPGLIKYLRRCRTARTFNPSETKAITEALLCRIDELIREKGSKFLIAYIPSPEEIRLKRIDEEFQFLKEFCELEKILLVNPFRDLLHFSKKPPGWKEIFHWDSTGNEIIGNKIAVSIMKDTLLSHRCN